MKPIKEGKVREIYDNGDSLIMVATDRISCFDVILKNTVNGKGKVLTQMSRFWFEMTEDIIPNHMISTDVNDMPPFFRNDQFAGRSMLCRKLRMLPIECIVRGYITGSGWESYQKSGVVCGITLPAGLKEADKLPEPIYTPSTKAEIGDHDENISYEQSVEYLEKRFPGNGRRYAEMLRDNTLALYRKCADYAYSRGIIIADTKFEFGLDENDNEIMEEFEVTVELLEIQKKVIPIIDDEWVHTNMPMAKSLEDLRAQIGKGVNEQRMRYYEDYKRNYAASELAKRFEGSIADEIYEGSRGDVLRQMRMNVQRQGVTWEQFVEQQGGEQQVGMFVMLETRQQLVQGYSLDAYYRHFNLSFTEDDINEVCEAVDPRNPSRVRKNMEAAGLGYALRESAERLCAAKHLVERANITVRETPAAQA